MPPMSRLDFYRYCLYVYKLRQKMKVLQFFFFFFLIPSSVFYERQSCAQSWTLKRWERYCFAQLIEPQRYSWHLGLSSCGSFDLPSLFFSTASVFLSVICYFLCWIQSKEKYNTHIVHLRAFAFSLNPSIYIPSSSRPSLAVQEASVQASGERESC